MFEVLAQVKREDEARPKPPSEEVDGRRGRMTRSWLQPLSEAAAAIRESRSIVLACHVNPDGDALGSLLGLALALIPLGKDVVCLSEDGVPDILRFLPGSELIRQTTDSAAFDLALVVDSGELSRVGSQVQPIVSRARRIVDIDHHVTAGAFGDIRVLDAGAASTAEIVYALLQTLAVPITTDIATCLFTGVITDTGSFRFQNVTPNTLRVAAELLEAGAPPAYISENVFDNRTFAATRLLGHALSALSQTPDGRDRLDAHHRAGFRDVRARPTRTRKALSIMSGASGARRSVCCSAKWRTAKSASPCAPARRSTSPRSPNSSAAAGIAWQAAAPWKLRWPKPSRLSCKRFLRH